MAPNLDKEATHPNPARVVWGRGSHFVLAFSGAARKRIAALAACCSGGGGGLGFGVWGFRLKGLGFRVWWGGGGGGGRVVVFGLFFGGTGGSYGPDSFRC